MLRRHPRSTPWLRVLREVLQLAGPQAQFQRHGERPWLSATFSGARHAMVLAFDGLEAITDGETFIAALPDHEFTVPRHLVADAVVTAMEHIVLPAPRLTVEIELLVLEEA
ncbi:hypothetical protein ASE49_13960 [Novosphingobium sp. Leaf2]|nr:hypothetical protein ASE49_13960 [Novosphingobium sp. Leaf2]